MINAIDADYIDSRLIITGNYQPATIQTTESARDNKEFWI
jgi:hypothetical protein